MIKKGLLLSTAAQRLLTLQLALRSLSVFSKPCLVCLG